MKKIIALLSCIATLFCLTSCEAFIDFFKVERFYYDFDEISKDMEKVEIIHDFNTVEIFINDGEASITQWLV